MFCLIVLFFAATPPFPHPLNKYDLGHVFFFVFCAPKAWRPGHVPPLPLPLLDTPLHTRELSAFFEFNISDLVHTLVGFACIIYQKITYAGEGVCPSNTRKPLHFLEFKISDLVHTSGEFLKYCLSKI